ncbi:MAG: DNA polymerase III subunit delta [Clostridia bacterium]|nr:DNA polymerase III subunit delta [Clostridia bacterium]
MNWSELYDEWKDGKVRPVYLFSGEEEYVKESAIQRLRGMLLPPGLESLNETVLTDPPASALIEAAETLPFMSDHRLVLVKDLSLLSSGRASKDMEADADRLCQWLKNPPPDCVTVFYLHGEGDGRKKLFTYIAKNHAAVKFDFLDDRELARWVSGQLKPDRKRMEPAALAEMTFLAGRSLSRLSSELEKLRAYVQDRPEITVSDVRAVVTPSLESSVFRLVDAVIDRDLRTAGQLTELLTEQGESTLGILAMLTRQVRFMAYMKAMRDAGEPLAAVEKRLSINHYGAQRTERQIRRFSADTLLRAYRDCVEADYSVKSGQARDRAALERVIFMLARMPRQA